MKNAISKIKASLIPESRTRKNRLKAQYIKDKQLFTSQGGHITHELRILHDMEDQAGTASGHYFHQDLLVASLIHQHNPSRHIDIGSRIDGFVAHVAAFRPIEVMDVRALKKTEHENIQFMQADLMNPNPALTNITDSLSCLHAIEHFGLGRYGDPIDAYGHHKGVANMLKMLKPGGRFYISFPIGQSNEVHFNAHRVFHPNDIFSWPDVQSQLRLVRFDFVDDAGSLQKNVNLSGACPTPVHGCGIYTWEKLNA